jgi:hypothetical protein
MFKVKKYRFYIELFLKIFCFNNKKYEGSVLFHFHIIIININEVDIPITDDSK